MLVAQISGNRMLCKVSVFADMTGDPPCIGNWAQTMEHLWASHIMTHTVSLLPIKPDNCQSIGKYVAAALHCTSLLEEQCCLPRQT